METDNFEKESKLMTELSNYCRHRFVQFWNHSSKNEPLFSWVVFFLRGPAILGRFWAVPWSGLKMATFSKVFVMDTPTAGAGPFWEIPPGRAWKLPLEVQNY